MKICSESKKKWWNKCDLRDERTHGNKVGIMIEGESSEFPIKVGLHLLFEPWRK
jgi:hypothetical protein